jgi:hypothetical protein
MTTSPWFAAPWLRLTVDFGQAAPAAAANSSRTPILRAACASFAIRRPPPAAARWHLVRFGPVPPPGGQQPRPSAL